LGATHTIAGATAGQVLRALGPTTAAFAQLQHGDLGGVTADQHHAKLHNVTDTTHHSIGGSAWDVVGNNGGVLGLLTPQDTVTSVQSALLRATGGRTTLYEYYATGRVRTPLVDTASGSLTLSPAGTAVLPTGSIQKDLGDYNRKWRSLYAAELYVETLVAQDVLSTIGGRIMVAPTTKLLADITSGQTTIDVEHNNLTGAYLYMASAPGGMAQVEVMRVTAGPSTVADGYRYTVTRNVDGSGANAWQAGDAVVNIGAVAGQGWIELTSTNTAFNHLGPTMTIYARTGMTAWTDAKPTVSVGNLRSFVDYGSDEFGFALGNDLALMPQDGFSGMTGDRVQGLRMFNTPIKMYNGPVVVGQWASNGQLDIGFDGVDEIADRDFSVHISGYVRVGRTGTGKSNLLYYSASGDLHLRNNATPVITLAGNGDSYFAGRMTIGPLGEIIQGTGTPGAVGSWVGTWGTYTGLRVGRDGSVGRLGGYAAGVLQAGFNSSGKITAGGGTVSLDSDGVSILAGASWLRYTTYAFTNASGIFGVLGSFSSGQINVLQLAADTTGSRSPQIYVDANGTSFRPGSIWLQSHGAADTILTIGDEGGYFSGTKFYFSTDELVVSNGLIKIGYNAPAYGVGIYASMAGGWARGVTFLDSGDNRLAQFGAYGGVNTLSFLYIGLYNDYVATFTPSTKKVQGFGEWATTGYFNGGSAFRRNGTEGGIYVPLANPPFAYDDGGGTWNNTAKSVGTYNILITRSQNGSIPSGAKAVSVVIMGRWSGQSSDTDFATLQPAGGALELVVRNNVQGKTHDNAGIVQVSGNYFSITVAGNAMAGALVKILGYFI
jgi:hypothetical protein